MKLTKYDSAKGRETVYFRDALVLHSSYEPLEVGKLYKFRIGSRENWVLASRAATQADIDAVSRRTKSL